MRIQKSSSTKSERRFGEILKKLHVPFKHRVILFGREIDFLIGNTAVEIGDHPQDVSKNKKLLEGGYSLIFFSNVSLREAPDLVEKHIINNWLIKWTM
jgi:hypothetical protein